jgi:hypothetical protein
MKNQSRNPSALKPRHEGNSSTDQLFRLCHWLGLFEGHLFHNAPESTYERYSRVLSRFYSHFLEKQYVYEFLRSTRTWWALVARVGPWHFNRPTDVAIVPDGTIYVSDGGGVVN